MQPSPAKMHVVRQWLTKAHRDLGAAEELGRTPEFRETAVYHCQQAAEKALKAYLVWIDVPPPRTHELAELLRTCASSEPAFSNLDTAARKLSPYAVLYRYPDAVPDPTDADTRDALRLARDIYGFTEQRVPPGARP